MILMYIEFRYALVPDLPLTAHWEGLIETSAVSISTQSRSSTSVSLTYVRDLDVTRAIFGGRTLYDTATGKYGVGSSPSSRGLRYLMLNPWSTSRWATSGFSKMIAKFRSPLRL